MPGLDYEELRAALEPYGRVEDLEVAGQRVGLRLHPREAGCELAPAGIELAPPRTERSTGRGARLRDRRVGGDLPRADIGTAADFTINAIAKRLATGELLDPFGGAEDLKAGVLRTVSPTASARTRCASCAASASSRSTTSIPTRKRSARCARRRRDQARLGERIGGGLTADGWGSCRSSCSGPQPAKALRLARETGVLVELSPEFEPAIGFDQGTPRQPYTLDEHLPRRPVRCGRGPCGQCGLRRSSTISASRLRTAGTHGSVQR